jgi:lipid-A-disaccharide synthase
MRRELHRKLMQIQPLAFIGIDAPDFNLGLELQLKNAGIPTVHYVSPTVWAWRPRRVHKISRAADLVLCLFPFEPDFYQGHGVAAVHVGHPLAQQLPLSSDFTAARARLGLEPHQRVIALLPGSRTSEVSRLASPMIEAAALLRREFPELRFVAAMANPAVAVVFRDAVARANSATGVGAGPGVAPVEIIDGDAHSVIAAANVVLCASGTATLETMLINRPMVSTYRLAPATYWLAKGFRLFQIQNFALPNILAGSALVPELIQDAATGKRLAEEARRWLLDAEACQALRSRFSALRKELLGSAESTAAAAIATMLQKRA